MSRYELGLRRRSPNPNSPIPYSPALLSPYEPQVESWDAAPRFGQEQHQHEHAPTIRLVGPSDAGSSRTSYHAPEPSRSRSDDRDAREARLVATDASLRRHGTDPKLYPSMGRQLSRGKRSTASLLSAENSPGDFERGSLDKPVPTLPLNIRRTKTPKSRPPSVVSDHTAASSNATASKSVASSRVFFQNPFRRSVPQTRSSSPTLSARSTRSYRSSLTRLPEPMSRSASNLSTTSTLLGPHYETAGWDKFEKVNSSEATLVNKLKSTGVGEKLTYKVPPRRDGGSQPWPKLKWTLLLSVLLLMGYGFAGLGWSLTILLKTRDKADVTMVSDPDIVIFLTLASLLCVFSAFVGMTGLVLDSRPILAFYNLLLWPALLSLCLVGYTSYKRGNMQLDRKLNQSWSQFLDDEQRLRIQNTLKCCGYYNPLHDATYSKRCYPRSALPGCKANWTVFEKQALHEFATAAFTVIPFHLVNIVAALLCSNHVDRQFGKGLTPPQYRLRTADVRANAIAVLTKLPDTKRPASVLSRQRAISRKDRSRSNFGYSSSIGDSVTLVDRSDSRGEKGMI